MLIVLACAHKRTKEIYNKKKKLFDKNYRNYRISYFTWQNYYDLFIYF